MSRKIKYEEYGNSGKFIGGRMSGKSFFDVELSPLERLKRIRAAYPYCRYDEEAEDLDNIETALKDYENLQLKHRSMQDAVLEDFKKLKALEIIKSFVRFDIIEVQGQWYLIQGTSFDKSLKVPITKEQAKFLKEVLL